MRNISILLFVSAFAVYGFRLYESSQIKKEQLFLTSTVGEMILNPKAFKRIIEDNHNPILSNQLFTLLVFLEPARLCPPVLEEAETWVSPKSVMELGMYDVHLFIPVEHKSFELDQFLMRHGLGRENVSYLEKKGGERIFSQFGVLIILYSQEKGILFHEFGNDSPRQFKKLEKKIMDAIYVS